MRPLFADQRNQHGGQVAHRRTIAAKVFGRRNPQASGGNVMADAPAAGIANIHRLATHPSHERIGDGPQIPAPAGNQGGTKCEGHLCVIGYAPRLQTQPATTNDVSVNLIPRGDFASRHEFHRGPQRVADGQTEVCPQGALPQPRIRLSPGWWDLKKGHAQLEQPLWQ